MAKRVINVKCVSKWIINAHKHGRSRLLDQLAINRLSEHLGETAFSEIKIHTIQRHQFWNHHRLKTLWILRGRVDWLAAIHRIVLNKGTLFAASSMKVNIHF